jgi:hypothetical protein
MLGERGRMTSAEPALHESDGGHTIPRTRSRILLSAVVVLAVAVIGLGGWLAFDRLTGGMPADIGQVLDDYLRAWEEKDEAAIRAVTTEDFVLTEHIYWEFEEDGIPLVVLHERVSDDIDGVVTTGFRYAWENEQVGRPVISGDGPWTVSVEENWIQRTSHYSGTATYVVVEEDGNLKIANHSWSGMITYGWQQSG